MLLVDSHAHLDEQSFDVDRQEVLARARATGIQRILCIGVTRDSSQRVCELARTEPLLRAAVGIHPNYTSTAGSEDFSSIVDLAGEPVVVAIGETGLDAYWDHAPLDLQIEYFYRHLELSRMTGKPAIVHCREAQAAVQTCLETAACSGPLKGVMHSFSGDADFAQRCLQLGLYLSFAGMLTYKRNAALREVAAGIPLDRLLLETDAPYLSPVPLRGKRNEPAYVVHTARCLAELRGLSLDELGAITTHNAATLFGDGF